MIPGFKDLPVRTKFLVTLGIPVLGMVMLLGKQVDGHLKRKRVYDYITAESAGIASVSEMLHALQAERGAAIGYLVRRGVPAAEYKALALATDQRLHELLAPARQRTWPLEGDAVFNGLGLLREQVLSRAVEPSSVLRAYRDMDQALLDELWRVSRLSLDPFTKERLYAHMQLVSAKQGLSELRDLLAMGPQRGGEEQRLTELSDRVAHYETSMALFERTVDAEVGGFYQQVFQGAEVNFLRSVIGIMKERRRVDEELVASNQWASISRQAIDQLKRVEDLSRTRIVEANVADSRSARFKLLVVIGALVLVVGGVMVMGVVIMRGLRRTVDEVTAATQALAVGDVSATVPVTSGDEVGRMAMAFNSMIDNIRSLSRSADAIGKGDYDTPVVVRSDRDMLGMALSRMRDNLKAARQRDTEQNLELQREKAKLQEANQRIELLIREMHHRVKNNLQVIASLLRLQAATFTDPRLQAAFDQSQNRVLSMALIHEKLYKGDELAKVDVALYIAELFAELVRINDVEERVECRTDVDPGLVLGLDTMVPLGLLMNELITNSFKHAFPGQRRGAVTLALHSTGEAFDLHYADDGVGMDQERMEGREGSLGTSLIESLVEQLNGHLTVDLSGQGTRYHIRFRTR
jgi:two-component sensor histidine kinase/HAMP domain-containing protein